MLNELNQVELDWISWFMLNELNQVEQIEIKLNQVESSRIKLVESSWMFF